MKTLFLLLTLLAFPVSAAGLCKCVDCKNPNCECTCSPGNCTCVNCAGKTPPPSLLLPPSGAVDVDDLYAFDGSAGRDSQWYADVEKALQYLYRSHQTMDARVTRLEQAMIRVNTPRGTTETRSVTVQNDCGTFQLNPGETLAGYQDIGTGRWVNAYSQTPQVVKYLSGNPVMSYPSMSMEVRTVSPPPSRSGGLLGAIRLRGSNCRTVNGVTYCSN